MRDPDYTKILLITLPEMTPVQEAKQLEKDLERASISSYAWIINQSLAPLNVTDPLLAAKRQDEFHYISQVMKECGEHVFLETWHEMNSENN